MTKSRSNEFKFLVPEVVQTSMMDCGPSSLKAILEGLGIPVNLGRLREACQTDVDGTSIDTLEDILVQIGIDAEQIVIPVDHLLTTAADTLPALLVIRQPDGNTHFIVVWRRLGSFVQIMDPAVGRRWVSVKSLLDDCYRLEISVPAADWRDWAGSEDYLAPVRERLRKLGIDGGQIDEVVSAATDNPSWNGLASLDAATRLTATLLQGGSISKKEARTTLTTLIELAGQEGTNAIPAKFWFVRPDPQDEEKLVMRGAVLVRVNGLMEGIDLESHQQDLSEDLSTAMKEPPSRPLANLFALLKKDGLFTPFLLIIGMAVAAAAVIAEASIFRALLTRSALVDGSTHQLILFGGTLVLLALLLVFEIPLASFALQIGRKLEGRMRIATLEKIPQLGDRYFSSRLVSDLAERSHAVYRLREVPVTTTDLLGTAFRLVFIVAALCWLDIKAAPLILVLAVVVIGTPLFTLPLLNERELRVRTHLGALSRYYLDSFLGLFAIRAHGADDNVKIGYQSRLTRWVGASQSFLRTTVVTEGVTATLAAGLIIWLTFSHYQRNAESATALLLIYWALQLPVFGQQLAALVKQVPTQRNIVLRLVEPLSAPEEKIVAQSERADSNWSAAKIDIENASVVAGGHTVLNGINLNLPPGEHVAVIGPSGAGKSSLVGILMGWHKLTTGNVRVDDSDLCAHSQQRLRSETAWLDPGVQVWNKTLLRNVQYGAKSTSSLPMDAVIDMSKLAEVVDRLPDGLQTVLGEGGALVSGGEGQRVRFARALSRRDARLVIFDEPFRGLARADRCALLKEARRYWRDATFICITHDLDRVSDFPRVVVVDNGTVIQDGPPATLMAEEGSRFRELYEAERAQQSADWGGVKWRKVTLTDGVVSESFEP